MQTTVLIGLNKKMSKSNTKHGYFVRSMSVESDEHIYFTISDLNQLNHQNSININHELQFNYQCDRSSFSMNNVSPQIDRIVEEKNWQEYWNWYAYCFHSIFFFIYFESNELVLSL